MDRGEWQRSEKQRRLAELKRQLEEAGRLSSDEIASQIENVGFQCIRCGDCCHGQDFAVVIFPFEVRRIQEASKEGWLDEAEPPTEGEWDDCGNFHTLEWRIRRNSDACKHYCHSSTCISSGVREIGSCEVYERRPLLCSTYPFYLDEGKLRYSECRGLGKAISAGDAKDLASQLIRRYQVEIEEAIALVSRYDDFKRGPPSRDGCCIVHDSEGEHRICWTEDLFRRCGFELDCGQS